jgi:coenzyme F420-0:L-glutamate ligase/coenzyme F420-1:gamma-L-glutamate ligase
VSGLELIALSGMPELGVGDDLAGLILAAAGRLTDPLRAGDVLAIAHKAVSKVEGRVRWLTEVVPGPHACELAAIHGKDARHVQVVLDESARLLRADRGRLIARTHHGFVCANAGVDASNAGDQDRLILLPRDPDASARALRARLRDRLGFAPAVVISDSFGRPWRVGQCEVAIGCAGLLPLDDWRGRGDAHGRTLAATQIAVADEAAAAADLARAKDSREPVVRLRGLEHHVTHADGPGAALLRRTPEDDLFY